VQNPDTLHAIADSRIGIEDDEQIIECEVDKAIEELEKAALVDNLIEEEQEDEEEEGSESTATTGAKSIANTSTISYMEAVHAMDVVLHYTQNNSLHEESDLLGRVSRGIQKHFFSSKPTKGSKQLPKCIYNLLTYIKKQYIFCGVLHGMF